MVCLYSRPTEPEVFLLEIFPTMQCECACRYRCCGCPDAGAAALTLVEEQAEIGALDGGVQVGVGEDHVGALTAQFQADALQVAAGGGLHDDLAGRVLAAGMTSCPAGQTARSGEAQAWGAGRHPLCYFLRAAYRSVNRAM